MPFYPTLAKAMAAARKVVPKNERNSNGYRKHYKKDPHLPSNPQKFYAKLGWKGWLHFLGSNSKPDSFYPTLAEASEAALKIIPKNERNQKGYRKYCELDPRLPRCPYAVYAKLDWKGWSHFYKKNNSKSFYSNLAEARSAALKIVPKEDQHQSGYRKHYKKDPRLPANPYQYYKDEWVDWYHFFGKKTKSFYPTLHEAMSAALRVVPEGHRTSAGYKKHYKKDPRLPACPDSYYINEGWQNWPYFFGKTQRSIYPSLAQARVAAIKAIPEGEHTQIGYKEFYKSDPQLPANPDVHYANLGWMGWKHFFNEIFFTFYQTLREAKTAARKITPKEARNEEGYEKHRHKDPRLPDNPATFYQKKGWKSWKEFYKSSKNYYPTLEEAKKAAFKVIPKTEQSAHGYRRHRKKDPRLPADPSSYYSNSWVNWPGFFNRSFYPTLEKAMAAAVRVVPKSEYGQQGYQKHYRKDKRLPSTPERYYAHLGWQSWEHFFGKNKKLLYPTLAEAMQAAQIIVPKNDRTLPGYKKHYKKDPRLPAAPEKYYKGKGWIGVSNFFGEEVNFYPTIEEAMTAALAVIPADIQNSKGYKKHYKKDPRLPSTPNLFYAKKGWISWKHFFGKTFYPTLSQAMAAVLKVVPEAERNQSGYQKYYKTDPRLPFAPDHYYVAKGWKSWYHFFGKKPK